MNRNNILIWYRVYMPWRSSALCVVTGLRCRPFTQRTAFLEKYRKSMNDEFKQPVNRNIYLQSPSEWVEIKLWLDDFYPFLFLRYSLWDHSIDKSDPIGSIASMGCAPVILMICSFHCSNRIVCKGYNSFLWNVPCILKRHCECRTAFCKIFLPALFPFSSSAFII